MCFCVLLCAWLANPRYRVLILTKFVFFEGTSEKLALAGDVAGANWADWQTAFVSRPGQQLFPLVNLPEINEENIFSVAKKLILIPFQQF